MKIEDHRHFHVLLNLLRFAVFALFIGRAWQHIFWDAPFRVLFWNQSLLEPIVEFVLGLSWNEYITNDLSDQLLQRTKVFVGFFYLFCALISLLVNREMKRIGLLLLVGSGAMFFLALLYMNEKYNHLGQFLEYSCQVGSPVLLYLMIFKKVEESTVERIALILVSFTFLSHGLYAVGFYPIPGQFIDMVIRIVHINESQTRILLHIVGVLDIVVAIGIFLPIGRGKKFLLIYAFLWGSATAMARIIANIQFDFLFQSLHQWLYQMIYRMPNAIVPLFILLLKNYYDRHPNSRVSIKKGSTMSEKVFLKQQQSGHS